MVATRNGRQHASASRNGHVANIVRELEARTEELNRVNNNLSSLPFLASRQAALGGEIPELDPRRRLYKECGWPTNPGIETYSALFERDAIANRVVTVYPNECWATDPEVYDNHDEAKKSKFEAKWAEIIGHVPVYGELHQADINAGIGQFSLLVLGFDDGLPLDQPILDLKLNRDRRRKPPELLWMNSYDEEVVTIDRYVSDPKYTFSPMYGWPEMYSINMAYEPMSGSSSQQSPTDMRTQRVHWSRCVHVNTGERRSSKIFSMPRMKPVLNRIADLNKCYGGSAEMLWQGGFMGLSIESLPNLELEDLGPEDFTAIKKQLFAYMNGLQRYIAINGFTAKPLHPQVADPTKHIQVQLEAICAALKVPLRVFMGTESGKAASEQQSITWNKRVMTRQKKVIDPYQLRPFVNRLIQVGTLPKPEKDQFYTSWVDLNAMSDKDKADVAMKRSQALTQYVTSGAETVCPAVHFWTLIMKESLKQAEDIIAAAKATKKTMSEKAWLKPVAQPGPGKSPQTLGKGAAKNGVKGSGRSRVNPKNNKAKKRPVKNEERRPRTYTPVSGRRNQVFTRRASARA